MKIDEELNPAPVRDRGEVYIEIGLAVTRPAEHIILPHRPVGRRSQDQRGLITQSADDGNSSLGGNGCHRPDNGSIRTAASTSWSSSRAIAQASFTECSGLGSTTEVIENGEGGDNTTVRKLPGKTTYSDITLKWGADAVHRAVGLAAADRATGNVVRKNGSIVVFDLANRDRGGALELRPGLADQVGGAGVQRQGQRDRDRDPGAGPRRARPGVTAGMLVTEVRVRAAEGIRRRRRARCTGRGVDAAGDGGRRDLSAARSAGAELARVPDRHPAVPGGDPARHAARDQRRASSRGCSPKTWPTCRTSTTGSTASTPRLVAVRLPALRRAARGGGPAAGGIVGYPLDRVHQEAAFLGRHVHWTLTEVLEPRPRPAAALGRRDSAPAGDERRRRRRRIDAADPSTGRRGPAALPTLGELGCSLAAAAAGSRPAPAGLRLGAALRAVLRADAQPSGPRRDRRTAVAARSRSIPADGAPDQPADRSATAGYRRLAAGARAGAAGRRPRPGLRDVAGPGADRDAGARSTRTADALARALRADAVTGGTDVYLPGRALSADETSRASPCWRTRRAHVPAQTRPRRQAPSTRPRTSGEHGPALARRVGVADPALEPGSPGPRTLMPRRPPPRLVEQAVLTGGSAWSGAAADEHSRRQRLPAPSRRRTHRPLRQPPSPGRLAPRPRPRRAPDAAAPRWIGRAAATAGCASTWRHCAATWSADLMRQLRTEFERGG